jgi:hypothetical protein
MPLSARFRRGTSPSFWRARNNTEMFLAASCMRTSRSGIVREDSLQELIADFEKRKTPVAARFVIVPSR